MNFFWVAQDVTPYVLCWLTFRLLLCYTTTNPVVRLSRIPALLVHGERAATYLFGDVRVGTEILVAVEN